MIDHGTRIEGFDARSWYRLVTLVAPWLASHAPHESEMLAEESGGALFVLHHESRVLGALHSHRGVVDIDAWPGPEGLEALARAHGASFALAAESGAVEELYERLGGRLRMDDDAATTLLVVLGALRELHEEQAIHVWPNLVPRHVPLPTPAVLQRAFDFLLPRGKCAVVALFADDALETAIVLRREGDRIDRVWGPEVLRSIVGPLGGDYRRDERVIRRAVEREIGPMAFGLFAEFDTLHALLRDTRAGAWGEAIASRDVVLDPMPAWAAVAAGAGVVRAAAQRSQRILTGLGILGAFTPAIQRVREFAETVGAFDVEKLLGFNPLRVLAQLLSHGRDRRDDRGV